MRAFIAIDLPESVRDVLAQEQARYRAVCPDARWTRPEGIHLTLKFLGEISVEQVEEVNNALKKLERFEKFIVQVKGFGFFPNSNRPRVFWAGLDAPPDLVRLAAQVGSAMDGVGFPPENRGFSPHLTLARFKVPRPQPKLQALLDKQSDPILASFEVSEFFLWESNLSPRGAEYRKVTRFP